MGTVLSFRPIKKEPPLVQAAKAFLGCPSSEDKVYGLDKALHHSASVPDPDDLFSELLEAIEPYPKAARMQLLDTLDMCADAAVFTTEGGYRGKSALISVPIMVVTDQPTRDLTFEESCTIAELLVIHGLVDNLTSVAFMPILSPREDRITNPIKRKGLLQILVDYLQGGRNERSIRIVKNAQPRPAPGSIVIRYLTFAIFLAEGEPDAVINSWMMDEMNDKVTAWASAVAALIMHSGGYTHVEVGAPVGYSEATRNGAVMECIAALKQTMSALTSGSNALPSHELNVATHLAGKIHDGTLSIRFHAIQRDTVVATKVVPLPSVSIDEEAASVLYAVNQAAEMKCWERN